MFSNNDGEFATPFSSGLSNEDDSTSELTQPSSLLNLVPWEDLRQAWRYNGDEVYTGDCFVYAPRPSLSSISVVRTRKSEADKLAATAQSPLPDSPNASTLTHDHMDSSSRESTDNAYSGDTAAQPPDATANDSPLPGGGNGWGATNILKLYKWKLIRKKGIDLICKEFPGEDKASLNAAWKMYRKQGKRLLEEEKAKKARQARGSR